MFIFISCRISLICGLSLLINLNKHLILRSSRFIGVFGDWRIIFDPIRVGFVSLLFLVTTFILVFSKNYIGSDVLGTQFFIVLGSFAFSIIILIFRENLALFFLGWDGLGISRFWLILWYQNNKGNISGAHTFSTIRIGDLFLLLAVLFWAGYQCARVYVFLAIAPVFFIMGAATKRAQTPFVTWLPLAMAAPTPVRALVHSSTLVTAGIYLVMRGIFYGFNMPPMLITLGAITALLGAYCSVIEYDLKKAIAYSTLRHCGLIIYGLGINCWDLVFFHLCVHALFKRLLFLIAGWVLSTTGGNQDLRFLGGLNRDVIKIFWCVNSLIIASLPSLGVWYRKHAILANQESWAIIEILFLLILRALSGVYIWRIPSWLLGTSGIKATGDIPIVFKISLALHFSRGVLILWVSPSVTPELSGISFKFRLIWLILLVPLIYYFVNIGPSWKLSAQNYLDQMTSLYLATPSKIFEFGTFEEARRSSQKLLRLGSTSSIIMIDYWTKGIVLTGLLALFICI